MPAAAKATLTVPARSDRNVRARRFARRPRVAGLGWPYVLSAPTEMSAIDGAVAARSASEVDVRLPW